MKIIYRKVTLLLVASITLALMLLCARFLVGHALLLKADTQLSNVVSKQGTVDAELMAQLDESIDRLNYWFSSNPDTSALVSSYYSLKAWNAIRLEEFSLADEYWELAGESIEASKHMRPMHSAAYLQQAEIDWRKGEPMAQVLASVLLAQQNAPFDRHVALFSLEFYFAYWPSLDSQQRLKAVKYIFNASEYRIGVADFEHIVSRTPQKGLACNLLTFNQVFLQACEQ
ncbi:hypothetical protein [Vibrio sinaloensis]|uniref:hypothetical protein n=1 Tax=Photobacterium sp. (strain ATCC 43367) TaxID=379097 RepID=UPI0035E9B969